MSSAELGGTVVPSGNVAPSAPKPRSGGTATLRMPPRLIVDTASSSLVIWFDHHRAMFQTFYSEQTIVLLELSSTLVTCSTHTQMTQAWQDKESLTTSPKENKLPTLRISVPTVASS